MLLRPEAPLLSHSVTENRLAGSGDKTEGIPLHSGDAQGSLCAMKKISSKSPIQSGFI